MRASAKTRGEAARERHMGRGWRCCCVIHAARREERRIEEARAARQRRRWVTPARVQRTNRYTPLMRARYAYAPAYARAAIKPLL